MGCARWGVWLVATGLMATQGGCRYDPPPPRVPVPAPQNREEPAKPMPDPRTDAREFREYPGPPPVSAPQASEPPPIAAPVSEPALNEPPLNERAPRQKAFVDAYNYVGKPQIVVFVNRTLGGSLVAPSGGPRAGEARPVADVSLRPGQYDESAAKSMDYEAMENVLMDWVASNGAVAVASPATGPKRLGAGQLDELQAGRAAALAELAKNLDADVLIQVQARPARQTADGLEMKMIGEAVNVRGGESIGRAEVDVPPPADKVQLNRGTQVLAGKLMDEMTRTWMNGAPSRGAENAVAAPGSAPGTR